MRNVISTALSLFVLFSAVGQETVPGQVKDSMQESDTAPSEIPSTAPSLSDIDRLFDDSSDDNAQAAAADDAANNQGFDSGLSSPLDQTMALDSSDLISVDYPNEEIRTVLRNVADLYQLNLVVPDTLQGKTSIKLRDVTWNQIYSVVLDPVGYTFVEDGPIIKVVSKDALNFEPPVTEIFMINYADATTIAGTIKNLVDASKGGNVQVDKRTNGLIVSERASKMGDITKVIERLDKPTQQVYIETRFIEVTDTDVKNIGLNWSSLRGVGVSAGPFTSGHDKSFARNREQTNNAENDALINRGEVNFTQGEAEQSGIGNNRGILIDNLTGQTVLDLTSIGQSNSTSAAIENLVNLVDTGSTTRRHSAVFTADQFGFVISALMEQGNSRLVSNPTLVTLNNQEAMISIGEQFPIPSYQYNQETGGFEVSGFDYKDIGVILKVTPSVNHTGLITLDITPEVSSRQSERTFGGSGGASIPVIATRRTQTRVALRDGYTMGIGGLMESSGVKNGNNVPVLGKIPGLKRLFSHENEEERNLNLLIFITARILPSEEADFEDVFSKEMMDAVGVDPVYLKNR